MESGVIETDMIREFINRIFSLHHCSGVSVWYGPSGAGKTVAARYLVDVAEQNVTSGRGSAFRATHYHVGEMPAGNMMKRSIKSLYEAALRRVMKREVYAISTTENLAAMFVRELRAEKIEMILVDDADNLSSDAIRGMTFAAEVAQEIGWVLSLILIGTEDLPKTVNRVPPLFRRITDWFHFREYGFEETWKILAGLHPHFGLLDRSNEGHVNQVRFVHEVIGGYPGPLVAFLRRLDYYSKYHGGVIDEKLLRAVYLMYEQDRERPLRKSTSRQR